MTSKRRYRALWRGSRGSSALRLLTTPGFAESAGGGAVSARPRLAVAWLSVALVPTIGVGRALALCIVARDGLADLSGDPL
jgi:hypothetical protein